MSWNNDLAFARAQEAWDWMAPPDDYEQEQEEERLEEEEEEIEAPSWGDDSAP